MKKYICLAMIVTLAGCTTLDNLTNRSKDFFESSFSGDLKTEKIVLNTTAPQGILNDISGSLKRGYVKEYTLGHQSNYEVYVGDYVSIPLDMGIDSFNVVYFPLGASYDMNIKNGKLVFRSIYQGSYEVMLYSNGSFSKKITIYNRLKYEFSEQNNYDIIVENYKNRNLKGLSDSVAIHRIAFPNSFRDKEISFMLIDLAGKDGNAKVIKEEIDFLQRYTKLDEKDKLTIINSLKMIGNSNFELSTSLLEYNSYNKALNEEIVVLIMKKGNPTQEEINFLERYYEDNREDEKGVGTFIGNWYVKNGNMSKGASYLGEDMQGLNLPHLPTDGFEGQTLPDENMAETQNYTEFLTNYQEGRKKMNEEDYVESIIYFEKALAMNQNYAEEKDIYFAMGESYFKTGEYTEAVNNFKKSLNLEKKDEKKAEIYYNIGITYDKLGDREQAVKYLTYVRQNYKTSSWSVKSSLYLLQQMQELPTS